MIKGYHVVIAFLIMGDNGVHISKLVWALMCFIIVADFITMRSQKAAADLALAQIAELRKYMKDD